MGEPGASEAGVGQNTTAEEATRKQKDKFKYQAGAFLTGVAGISLLGGFGTTLGMTKKKDPNMFNKGILGARELQEAGGALAMRALGWGTLYAVSGVSLICFTVWKLMGVQNLGEFRVKAGGWLPRIPRNNPPEGRTEFSGLNDLLQYLIDEDARKKQQQQQQQSAAMDTEQDQAR